MKFNKTEEDIIYFAGFNAIDNPNSGGIAPYPHSYNLTQEYKRLVSLGILYEENGDYRSTPYGVDLYLIMKVMRG